MGSKRDYYEVLSVSREAGADELRKAYRQLALKYHPDRNPNNPQAEALFKEATEAYGVLSDEQKRARYDKFGHAGLEGGDFDGNANDIFSHFQDLFAEFFGGAGGPGGQRGAQGRRGRGSDVRVQERLTLREAFCG
ncbi:MAG TPA: DnaJ domain-containing protein, partial [Polyangiaceae bacterium]|nr:DnaJ domain-containing protein [Polyangiaceae bacterium]